MVTGEEISKALAQAGIEENIFPLQTIQSMAERWGVTRQTVFNWNMRDAEFPKAMRGVLTMTSRTPRVYPLYEVERYEKLRGLSVNGNRG